MLLFANGNLADSIRSVSGNVNIQLDPATTPQDIIERLRQGRYDGLAKDELKRDKKKTLIITSDSAEGQALAQKLNIQTHREMHGSPESKPMEKPCFRIIQQLPTGA